MDGTEESRHWHASGITFSSGHSRRAAAIGATSAVAATDIFAKIGDIKGESADDKHRDEIEVLAWSWGLTAR